jgi:hypothetical protein
MDPPGCCKRADNAPTGVALGRAIAGVPLRARSKLHRPMRASIEAPAERREGGQRTFGHGSGRDAWRSFFGQLRPAQASVQGRAGAFAHSACERICGSQTRRRHHNCCCPRCELLLAASSSASPKENGWRRSLISTQRKCYFALQNRRDIGVRAGAVCTGPMSVARIGTFHNYSLPLRLCTPRGVRQLIPWEQTP